MQVKYLDFQKEFYLREKKYLNSIAKVFKSGYYILGNEVSEFEKEFAKYLNVKYCIGVANGLESIQIGLMTLGIKKGDEVITTPISAVATTLAIIAVGATPVFCDVRKDGQIDENLIEEKITSKTKAVLPVHLYGQPCNMDKIKEVCKKYNLFLIEDAAQAHGSKYKEKKLGSIGKIGCFSFYPTKNLGAVGDGGALVTSDKKIADLAFKIRDYGQESKYIHSVYGLNSRLDELQASLLRFKLAFLDKDNNIRRKIAEKYYDELSPLKNLEVVASGDFKSSNFHLFVIRTKKRDQLKAYLFKKGIPTLIHYPISIPDQPLFKGAYKKLNIPIARQFVKEILSLPCHPFMEDYEVNYVIKTIKDFFK